MKAAYAVGGAGIDAIALRDEEVVAPGPGEAQVRLRAATLNFRDLLFVSGRLSGMTKQPEYVPLSCATGEVIALGEGVTRVRVGDRVNPIFSLGWISGRAPTGDMLGGTHDGVARQVANFPAESLCRVPDQMGDLEAATMTCAGLTAWQALWQRRPLQPGQWVLCHGTGGVSLAALQFAKAAGARVFITSSSDAKLARAKALGADLTVNYRTEPDWAEKVREETGGIDVVIDVVGESQLDANLATLKPDGYIAAIGLLGSNFSWNRAEVMPRMEVITVGNRDEHEAMLAFCASHAIRPVVDVVYDLERIGDAYRHLESGQFFGKIGINLL